MAGIIFKGAVIALGGASTVAAAVKATLGVLRELQPAAPRAS